MVSRLWNPSDLLDIIFNPIFILQQAVVLIYMYFIFFMQSYFFEVCISEFVCLKSVKGSIHQFYYNVYKEKKTYLCMLLKKNPCQKKQK